MRFKKMLFLSIIFFTLTIDARCNRSDRKHVNKSVVHCTYQQEDIYRCYGKKVNCYKNEQLRAECFFCGCPIEEHTRLKDDKKKPKKRV